MADPVVTTDVVPSDESVRDPRLVAWERTMNPFIMAAALVPIVIALTPRGQDDPWVLVDLASWLIFLIDLGVHLRLQRGYLRSGLGKFDAGIVVLTFPWYLIPGFGGAAVLGLARLGRVLRLVLAGGSTGVLRRLISRLGKAGLYSLALIFVCSVVEHRVEPASAGFTTLGDSLWWGFVTFTTVGYGDMIPSTTTGRVVAVLLMIGGVALIGLLAASLADFLSPTGTDADGADADGTDADGTDADGNDADGAETDKTEADGTDAVRVVASASRAHEDELLVEVRALRVELAELRAAVERSAPPPVPPA